MKSSLTVLFLILSFSTFAQRPKSQVIPQGRFTPLYGIEKDQKDFGIKSFRLDTYPVTVLEFKRFLISAPEWSKENIKPLYADKNYLTPKKSSNYSPVVYISWFAANAYCKSKQGRLPSTLEWEYVAAASESLADASRSGPFVDKILAWYSRPETETIQTIGKEKANFYGIHDLHGLVWEWTGDFNSVIMTSDNRGDGDKQNGMFCGSGSIASRTKEDYAGFVRYSLRSSLQANFTLTNLGFRCAYEL